LIPINAAKAAFANNARQQFNRWIVMETKQFQSRLIQRRDELLRRVSQLKDDVHHRPEPFPADFAEQAVELENLDVLFELDAEGRAELAKVNRALMRLESSEYDVCSHCGSTISNARLEAIPYTDLCVDCARAEEAEHAQR
jgi:DnaK suppressor protein